MENASKLIVYLILTYLIMSVSFANYSLAGYVFFNSLTLAEEDIEQRELERIESLKKDYTWQIIKCEVTAYTLNECEKNPQHPYYGITAYGYKVLEGRTVAASPELPPLSLVMISGLGNIFRVEDRGGAIKTHKGKWPGVIKIDIYTTDTQWARDWGRKLLECKILAEHLTFDA